jgi:YesN/AraC family two-component response regulator
MSFIEIEYRKTDKEWNMADLQAHNFYEIYYLLKGERHIFIEDKIFTLHENSIVIIPPFYMHKTEGGPYERVNVYLSNDLLDENERKFLSSCSSILSFELENSKKNMLFSLFRPFLEETDKEDLLKKKYSLSFAKTFLYILQSSTLTPLSYAPSISKNNANKNLILDIVAYINTHFQENITLESLKNKFFISKNTLCKNFQQVMHCSVMEYCSAVRLNEAKHLLLTTTKSIEDIADLCGYSSANYFSLLFKSKTGLAPSTYRKKK